MNNKFIIYLVSIFILVGLVVSYPLVMQKFFHEDGLVGDSQSSLNGKSQLATTPSQSSSNEQSCAYYGIQKPGIDCAPLVAKAGAELDSWLSEVPPEEDDAPKSASHGTKTDATYGVSNGEVISLVDGSDSSEYRDLWSQVAELSPDAITNAYVERFNIYSEPSDDTLAYVSDDDGNGKWDISINLPVYNADSVGQRKITLVHELGHVISLNTSKVSAYDEACPNLLLDEGCVNASSPLNLFWQQYWKGKNKPSYIAGEYVSEYAATDVVEDFAETFSYYVMVARPPQNSTFVKDKKISFFATSPELVTIRTEMRKVLMRSLINSYIAN